MTFKPATPTGATVVPILTRAREEATFPNSKKLSAVVEILYFIPRFFAAVVNLKTHYCLLDK